MINRILTDIKNAPTRLADRGKGLRTKAKTRLDQSRERAWEFEVDALGRAEDLLQKTPDVPVFGRLADAAERLVHNRFAAATALALDNYDDLGAKKIVRDLRGLDRLELLRVQRHEAANKNRKTVLQAVERELARLDAGVAKAA